MPPRYNLSTAAVGLQGQIRARGDYGNVTVTARGGHFHIRVDGEVLARVEPVGLGRYALAFRNHAGRWEPMPVQGTLAEVAEGAVEMLAPYLRGG